LLNSKLTQADIDFIKEEASQAAITKNSDILMIQCNQDTWKSPLTKHITPEQRQALIERLQIDKGDLIIISAGSKRHTLAVMGRLRISAANLLQKKGLLILPPRQFNCLWVVDFPLFDRDIDTGMLQSNHHPFTAPIFEDLHLLEDTNNEEQLERIRGQHYDCVINGSEVCGGSIRIHNPVRQNKIFDALKLTPEYKARFTHLIEALGQGGPPHGGIALGFDRLISILCNAKSLREVIAFPKTSTGQELMTGSPQRLDNAELDVLINLIKNNYNKTLK